MNELRRKIVLGSPLMTAGLLTGCGGGGHDASEPSNGQISSQTGGLMTAQAIGGTTGQTLQVSATTWLGLVDDIWWNTNGGGNYFVPSASPSAQALINGTTLYLSLVEQVNVSSTVKIIKSMVMAMDNRDGIAPALNSTYTIDGAVNKATVRILKRTTSGSTITDTAYSYRASNKGTVKVTGVTPSSQTFKLTFSQVQFDALAGLASKSFLISGDTTLVIPTQTANWL